MKIGKLEFRVERHSMWALCHLVHYNGHMHTFWAGPVALVVAWNRPDPFGRKILTPEAEG